jgi:hypothetical protein
MCCCTCQTGCYGLAVHSEARVGDGVQALRLENWNLYKVPKTNCFVARYVQGYPEIYLNNSI